MKLNEDAADSMLLLLPVHVMIIIVIDDGR